MISHLRRGVVLLSLAFAATGAAALGFGAIPGTAVLGMPLDLRVPLRLEPGEDVNADCLSAQVQFGDVLQTPGTVAVRLDPAVPGLAERVIRIQTTARVNEPVVTIDLSAGCASRIARTLTLFADPPMVSTPAVADSQPSEIGRGAAPSNAAGLPPSASSSPASASAPSAQPSASLAQAQQAGAAADVAPPRKAQTRKPATQRAEDGSAEATPRPRSGRPAAQAVAPPASGAAPRKAPALAKARAEAAASAAPAATPRLRLSTLEEGAAARPAVSLAAAEAASAAAAAEAAASATMAASAAEAAASARAAELEAASQKLRAEVERTQRQINELSAKLREVESGKQGEPLIVYLLGALVLLLSGALWFMWRQREQDKRASSWMDQPAAAAAPAALQRDAAGRGPAGPASQPLPLSGGEAVAAPGFPKDEASDSRSGLQSEFDSIFAPLGRPRRAVSVEELIDLEQQAEFFIVLGQDEAAIELLTSHLGSSTDSSPLPYLKLLEIYKRRGERSEYERLRERFNRHFAGNAPDWETDLQGGRSLPDYPETMERLERLWASPKSAMEMLQNRLLRDVKDDPQTAADRQAFDLPAYRELMLLYSIARDLAETAGQAGAPDIDLPLEIASPAAHAGKAQPDGAMPPVTGREPLPASPGTDADSVFGQLMATMPVEPQPQATQALSIDLSLDEIETWPGVDPSGVKPRGPERGT